MQLTQEIWHFVERCRSWPSCVGMLQHRRDLYRAIDELLFVPLFRLLKIQNELQMKENNKMEQIERGQLELQGSPSNEMACGSDTSNHKSYFFEFGGHTARGPSR